MRKGFFAIVLVAASFAGGAAVNGPGLRWARDLILNTPELISEEAPKVVSGPETGPSEAPPRAFPAAPIPPVVIKADPAKSKGQDKGPSESETVPPLPPPVAAAPAPLPASEALPPLDLSVIKVGESDRPDPEKEIGRKDAPSPSPVPAAPAPLSSSGDRVRDAKSRDEPWADAPGSAPAAAVPPRPVEAPAASASTSIATPGAPDGWAEVRRTMRDLGVARYGIEGEPGGRVRFHCVIPLAGRRAVGQQFEAEADDEIEAARTALRRVALWRATEAPRP